MTQLAYALLAFNLSILLTVQVVESQHVPKTCRCPQVKNRVQRPISDLIVTPKGPTCLQNEIIVIQQTTNKHVCLNPEGRQGKILLECWQRMQKVGKDSKNCVRQQNQRLRKIKRKQAKSKMATS